MISSMAQQLSTTGKFKINTKQDYSSGSIANMFIVDPTKDVYHHPNKFNDITKTPRKAFFDKEKMLTLVPLSEMRIDEGD